MPVEHYPPASASLRPEAPLHPGPLRPLPFRAGRRLDGLVRDIHNLSGALGRPVRLNWPSVVEQRATILGLSSRGRVSAGGTARLCRTLDGWAAINLSRPDDLAAVPALTAGSPPPPAEGSDPWHVVEAHARSSRTDDLVGTARLLGVPAAALASEAAPASPYRVERWWPPGETKQLAQLRVVDLSAMWAGPLAAMVLAAAGSEVVKVEAASRPDGARQSPRFYEALHPPCQRNVVLQLSEAGGRAQLVGLLEEADVVIEASRPRALEQLGAGPADLGVRPGRVWLAITGYGRGHPGSEWVAFGDDAAVAGGLVGWEGPNAPAFCGDAAADPVSGLFGARAVLEAIGAGGGALIDLSMSGCAAFLAASEL